MWQKGPHPHPAPSESGHNKAEGTSRETTSDSIQALEVTLKPRGLGRSCPRRQGFLGKKSRVQFGTELELLWDLAGHRESLGEEQDLGFTPQPPIWWSQFKSLPHCSGFRKKKKKNRTDRKLHLHRTYLLGKEAENKQDKFYSLWHCFHITFYARWS